MYWRVPLLAFITFLFAACNTSKKMAGDVIPVYSTSAQTELYGVKEKETIAYAEKKSKEPYRPLKKRALKRKYAAILKVPKRKIKNIHLYAFIDEWLGTNYKWGGNDKTGIDCSGFAQQLYKQVYASKILRTSIEQYQHSKTFKRQRRFNEGDLIFFHPSGEKVSHVGVYLRNGYFIHASLSAGVTISNLNDRYWQKCYACGGKITKK